ncbi:MAG: RES domain-containing protein [Verrucomicrobiales bacterium]
MSCCCPNCFENQTAKDFITENGEAGDCDYCGSEEVVVIDARELHPLFEGLLALFVPMEEGEHYSHHSPVWNPGESLAELLQHDWSVLSEGLDLPEQENLLDEIRGFVGSHDGNHAGQGSSEAWARREDGWSYISPKVGWEAFSYHIKKERRFVFDSMEHEVSDPHYWAGDVISGQDAVLEIDEGVPLYRGRIGAQPAEAPQSGLRPLPADKMGAPPSEVATAGRANSHGIPVFYAAFDPTTALYETGRFPGATVSVREMRATETLRIADLTQIHGVDDPLGVPDLGRRLPRSQLLNKLNEELSRPIHQDDSALEYLPTQYLAEAIQEAGFDGILYKSSLNPEGRNLVVFDPEKVRVTGNGNVQVINGVAFQASVLPGSQVTGEE